MHSTLLHFLSLFFVLSIVVGENVQLLFFYGLLHTWKFFLPLLQWESIFRQISVYPFLIDNAFWILWTLSCYFISSLSAHIRGLNNPTDLSPAVRRRNHFIFHTWIWILLLQQVSASPIRLLLCSFLTLSLFPFCRK